MATNEISCCYMIATLTGALLVSHEEADVESVKAIMTNLSFAHDKIMKWQYLSLVTAKKSKRSSAI